MSNRRKLELFEDFQKWGWDAKGWSPRTRKKYLIEALAADKWLTDHRDTNLIWATTKDLQAYLFSKPPHARTRNYVRQALLGFGNFLVAKELVQVNPAMGLPSLPTTKTIPKALDVLQASRVISAGEIIGGQVDVLVKILLFAGLRKTEAQLLEWRNFDEGFTWLRLRGKGNKDRVIPVHEKLQWSLASWKARSNEPRWVLPSTRHAGKPVSQTIIARQIKDVGALAGLPDLHPHVLRHTAATRLYEVSQGDIRTVQEFLGHSSPQTTAIYTRIRPARLAEAVTQLDFSRKSKPPANEEKETS